jgi:hypothetical protein
VVRVSYSRQEIVAIMRRTGYTQLADEAERVLPDPVDIDQIAAFAQSHGVDRDTFVSEMGGSP